MTCEVNMTTLTNRERVTPEAHRLRSVRTNALIYQEGIYGWRMLKRVILYGLCTALAFCISPPATADPASPYVIRSDRWSQEDEEGYSRFIQAIGESDCSTLDSCLRSPANPFFGSDPPELRFAADCSDLTYLLRFYYAWKKGLPFSYVSGVASRDGRGGDIRYSHAGNRVTARTDVLSGASVGRVLGQLREAVSSASYRIHPEAGKPLPDFYSPAIRPQAIRPGTVIYDPAGHVATVYRVDPDGRVHSIDGHTDFTLTQITYDVRFARTEPAKGAGFKNWRPVRLVGAKQMPDSTFEGGHIVAAANAEIPDYSLEQYYGNGKRPADKHWQDGSFTLNGEQLGYYDFVRGRLAGGKLLFDPLQEVKNVTRAICSDLRYRTLAVQLAVTEGIAQKPQPPRLPRNIYGTSGDWETYSTPSRDARLKTLFKYLRDTVQRFVEMASHKDTAHLNYDGEDIAGDMLRVYYDTTRFCPVQYRRNDGSTVTLTYEEARQRLFAMSFDPYHCPERRWGATDAAELSTCPDDTEKQAWYEAEQNLRNQTDRTYDARMDFTLEQLRLPGAGKGVPFPPDTDVIGYLERIRELAREPFQPVSAR